MLGKHIPSTSWQPRPSCPFSQITSQHLWTRFESSALATLDLSVHIFKCKLAFCWELFLRWQSFSVMKRCLDYCYFIVQSWDCFALSTVWKVFALSWSAIKQSLQNPSQALALEHSLEGKGSFSSCVLVTLGSTQVYIRVTNGAAAGLLKFLNSKFINGPFNLKQFISKYVLINRPLLLNV